MHKDRLMKLAALLKTVPDEKFDLQSWAVAKAGTGVTHHEIECKLKSSGCGATACAFGWAATIPEFKALGLKMERFLNTQTMTIRFLGNNGFMAASYFFDIDLDDAIELFAAWHYPDPKNTTAKQVAAAIEDFCNS